MDVDTLKAAGPVPAMPEAAHEIKLRAEQPAEPKAEIKKDKREKPDVTLRSGKFKASSFTGRIKGALVNVPLKAAKVTSSKNAIEFDSETDQFRVVKKTIESANKRMVGASSMFQYSIHERTKQIMIRVIDKETKELLLEIPPEKALDAIAKMWELAGIFIDEKR